MWAVLNRHARPHSKFAAADGSAPDRLQSSDLNQPRRLLAGLSGIPVTADSCAYEPIQKLLALGTSDGRIKIIGQEGVERAALSSRGAKGTRQLQFLLNRGVLLRLCKVGCSERVIRAARLATAAAPTCPHRPTACVAAAPTAAGWPTEPCAECARFVAPAARPRAGDPCPCRSSWDAHPRLLQAGAGTQPSPSLAPHLKPSKPPISPHPAPPHAVACPAPQGGTLELFGVEDIHPHSRTAPLHVLQLDGDEITTVVPLKREPYLLLGCLSGNVKVAMLVNSAGAAITEARQARGLKLMQYEGACGCELWSGVWAGRGGLHSLLPRVPLARPSPAAPPRRWQRCRRWAEGAAARGVAAALTGPLALARPQ
jgi:hypothetical protein